MFLKSLEIENESNTIRELNFTKGLNLIVDDTKTHTNQETGNNVGKTTVLRLIDFCLAGDGKNIYKDAEFKNHSNNNKIEEFLKTNNILITLTLKVDLEDEYSQEIVIKRNFLSRSQKIQEINGEKYKEKEFPKKLKELIFHSDNAKPTFRQIIAKNIRDEKNRLINTVKILHPTTKQDEYEALYLFWLGLETKESDRKQTLLSSKKIEKDLQKRLRKENNLPAIEQSLLVINRQIEQLTERKNSFHLNENYENEIEELNRIKSKLNRLSTELSRLELRMELINESQSELESEHANIDTKTVKELYEQAQSFIPKIQKSFEETLEFHNKMIEKKKNFITQEVPKLEAEIVTIKSRINSCCTKEKQLLESLKSTDIFEELETIIKELNSAHEKKGNFEELKKLWKNSIKKVKDIDEELLLINKDIDSQDSLISARIAEFNKYFSALSLKLYGEQFVLSAEKNEKGYELIISSISGNLGTGKKKGQIAAFDLSYIQFAEKLGLDCLHFILHDQIENIHDNQINKILTEIVSEINCQYIVPVLRDKLPSDINVSDYEILSLSQSDKLFKLP